MADAVPAANAGNWPEPGRIHTIVFDFDGVFTDNAVYLDASGVETVRCDRGDGLGIEILRRARSAGRVALDAFILSRETNPVVRARAKKLELDCHHGIGSKIEHMRQHFGRHRPQDPAPFAGTIVLGNDLNDLALMRAAAFSVAPADAHPRVRQIASSVLPQAGGHGFVRAFVERFLGLERLSAQDIEALIG